MIGVKHRIVAHLATGLPRITQSPTIASSFAPFLDVEVIVLGGRLFRHSMVNVGSATTSAAKSIRCDLFFLGVTGVHPLTGLTTGDFEEAQIKQTLMHQSAETVVLASAEKLGAASHYYIAKTQAVSRFVVRQGPKSAAAKACLAALAEQNVLVQNV